MKITTIIATYNGNKYLREAIQSFARQDHPNKELIVIDGGSTDGTYETLQAFDAEITSWVSEPDEGIYDAWNKGLELATGDYLHFLCSDDAYATATVFSDFVARMGERNGAPVVLAYGGVDMVDENGRVTRRLGQPWRPEHFRTVGMSIPHQGCFHHRTLFERYGMFSTVAGFALDYEFLLRYLKDNDAVFLPKFIVCKMGNDGISSQPSQYLSLHRWFELSQRIHGTYKRTPESILIRLKILAIHSAQIISPRITMRVLRQIRQLKLMRPDMQDS